MLSSLSSLSTLLSLSRLSSLTRLARLIRPGLFPQAREREQKAATRRLQLTRQHIAKLITLPAEMHRPPWPTGMVWVALPRI